ncbi:MAG: lipoyl(octanoyl) transferase LipB [Gammaproteobacteria bacterium]
MIPARLQTRGLIAYERAYRDMRLFNDTRDGSSLDELWVLEHPPVYTLGLAGRREHVIDAGGIPVIQTDRGGQVTYHGPGQLVIYLMLDMKRLAVGVREYVTLLEQSMIDMLAEMRINAARRSRAPGVYVDDRKIAALGVRIRRGCCYHGLALNVDMDLKPFTGINPCGFEGLEVTQLSHYGVCMTVHDAAERLLPLLMRHLGLECSSKEDMPLHTVQNQAEIGA